METGSKPKRKQVPSQSGNRFQAKAETGSKLIGKLFPIVIVLIAIGCSAQSNSRDLYVTQVIDGDTIELSNGERVRYIGIDTPELRKKKGDNWVYSPMPYAEEAKDFNQNLVEGKKVRLEFDVQRRDVYNRLLAYVYVEDKMINLEMVAQGYAMVYTYPPNVKYVEDFLEAQRYARDNNMGLWGDLEESIIYSSEAKENIGLFKMVETEVVDTYLSDKVLILNCKGNFKVVIFRDNLQYFPKEVLRTPESYFKYKTVKVYGEIKEYKGASEIIVYDPSQIEVERREVERKIY